MIFYFLYSLVILVKIFIDCWNVSDLYEFRILSTVNDVSENFALEELQKNAGIQFDLELIKIFIQKVLEKTFNKT